MKHTKGPWFVEFEYNVFQEGTKRSVAACGGHTSFKNYEATEEENKANAKLIAAAPDLLSVCEIALARYEWILEEIALYNSTKEKIVALARYEWILKEIALYNSTKEKIVEEMNQLKETIAKAKGENQ